MWVAAKGCLLPMDPAAQFEGRTACCITPSGCHRDIGEVGGHWEAPCYQCQCVTGTGVTSPSLSKPSNTDLIFRFASLVFHGALPFGAGETPAYHYGTHYSSAMIVASYLVRMEPFTQIFLRLQVKLCTVSLTILPSLRFI